MLFLGIVKLCRKILQISQEGGQNPYMDSSYEERSPRRCFRKINEGLAERDEGVSVASRALKPSVPLEQQIAIRLPFPKRPNE